MHCLVLVHKFLRLELVDKSLSRRVQGAWRLFISSDYSFDIVQDLKLYNILNFYSADCVMIVLLVEPPTHGVELPEGI